MGKLTRLDQVRRREQVKKRLGGLLALLLIAAGLLAVYTHRGDLAAVGLGAMMSDWVYQMTAGESFPVEVAGTAVRELVPLGSRVAVLDETGISVYNQSGGLVENSLHRMQNPQAAVAGRRVLLYDCGYQSWRLYDNGAEQASHTMAYTILCGDVNEEGQVAIATTSEGYASQVTVFSREKQELFRWFSADGLVAALSMAPRGNLLAAATVQAVGGTMQSQVYLLDITREEPLGSAVLTDEMVLRVACRQDGQALVLTDRGAYLLDREGQIRQQARFEGALSAFAVSQEAIVLVLDGYGGSGVQVVVYNAQLEQAGRLDLAQAPNQLQLTDNRVVLRQGDQVDCYDLRMQLKKSLYTPDARRIAAGAGALYYITTQQLQRVAL